MQEEHLSTIKLDASSRKAGAFKGKTFSPPRHKDAKMNINQKISRFAWCLGVFVAICSGLSGLGG